MAVARRFTVSQGFRLSFMLAGDGGRTLVLVPGIMQSANRWREAGYTDALEGDFRVIIPDPLGHGASEKARDPAAYTMTSVVKQLLAVFDATGIERAVLWGYSRGGIVAAQFAAAHPGRVEALVLGGSAAVLGLDPEATHGVDALAAALATGEWAEVFRVLRIEDHEAQERLSQGNDPLALAYAAQGTAEASVPNVAPFAGRVFAYAGDAEPNYAAARVSASRLGILLAAVPGQGNVGTFAESALVVPLVRAFLAG